jgi:hypothetical protein
VEVVQQLREAQRQQQEEQPHQRVVGQRHQEQGLDQG